MKQQLPVWSIVAAIAAALIVVVLVLFKGPSGEASKEELTKIRQNQRNFSAGAPPEFHLSQVKLKLYGIDQATLKAGTEDVLPCARLARRLMGPKGVVRVDANMAWDGSESLEKLRALRRVGVGRGIAIACTFAGARGPSDRQTNREP